MKNNLWNVALLSLLPFGEIKAIFYHSDLRVDWYIFSDNKRYLCNVLEDYAIAITFIVIFAYMYWAKKTPFGVEVIKFLFVVSLLDILHLGAFDKQGLIMLKFSLAIIIWALWRGKAFLKVGKLWQQ